MQTYFTVLPPTSETFLLISMMTFVLASHMARMFFFLILYFYPSIHPSHTSPLWVWAFLFSHHYHYSYICVCMYVCMYTWISVQVAGSTGIHNVSYVMHMYSAGDCCAISFMPYAICWRVFPWLFHFQPASQPSSSNRQVWLRTCASRVRYLMFMWLRRYITLPITCASSLPLLYWCSGVAILLDLVASS